MYHKIYPLKCKIQQYLYLGLNNKHLFQTLLASGKLKIKVPEDLILGEGPFLACRQSPFCCFLT